MSRFAVVALLATLSFGHSAFAEFSGELISYGELMSLSSEKRMAYLAEVRQLMGELERDQLQYEVSATDSDTNEKFANVWQLLNPLPEANAARETGDVQTGTPTLVAPDGSAAASEAPTVPAPAVQAPAAQPTPEQPPGKAPALKPAPPAEPPPVELHPKGEPKPTAPQDLPVPPRRPTPPKVDAAGKCPEPGFNCRKMNATERQEEIQKFRADKNANICVSGGFFSTYATPTKKAHTCHIYHEFPPGSKTPAFSCKSTGGGPKALCNPLLYCLAVKGKVGATGKPKLVPVMNCVDYGGKAGSNITQACDKWYAESKGLPFSKDNPNALKEPCDPAQVFADLMGGTKEAWEEIRKAMAKKYDQYCLRNKGFEALFCGICNSMGKHIHKANVKATGTGCAKEAPADQKPEAAPAKAAQ